MAPIRFLLVEKSSPSFFRPIREWNVVDQVAYYSELRYADPFRRYWRSKSKDLKIALNFGRFSPPKFRWSPFQKLYQRCHACLETRRLVKFRQIIPTNPKVMSAHKLNFKTNFKCSPLFFGGWIRLRLGCALVSLGQSLAYVKIWVASIIMVKIYSPEKVDLGGSKLTFLLCG